MTDDKADRRAAFESYMDSLPCAACAHDANLNWSITDDHSQCSRCNWMGSGSYLHTCKTGWRKPVCNRCNAAIQTAPDQSRTESVE